MVDDPRAIALPWLSDYARSLTSKDVHVVADLFLPNGWLRDVLVFSWDNRSLEGPAKIKTYLSTALPDAKIDNTTLDERPGLEPRLFAVSPEISGVEVAFTFEVPLALGRGYARLLPDASRDEAWKALSVYMTLDSIKGSEELGRESGLYGHHTTTWQEVREERRAEVENNPEVLVGKC